MTRRPERGPTESGARDGVVLGAHVSERTAAMEGRIKDAAASASVSGEIVIEAAVSPSTPREHSDAQMHGTRTRLGAWIVFAAFVGGTTLALIPHDAFELLWRKVPGIVVVTRSTGDSAVPGISAVPAIERDVFDGERTGAVARPDDAAPPVLDPGEAGDAWDDLDATREAVAIDAHAAREPVQSEDAADGWGRDAHVEGSHTGHVVADLGASDADPKFVPSIRMAPEGTDDERARAFERLPVSPDDRPPIGAVGEDGIHIDRIAVGSRFVHSECKGVRDSFSLAKLQRISVCFRAVHPREDQELTVLWGRDGGTERRAKVAIPGAKHAHRTRAYLVLRAEYAGHWTVRIMSADDAELARTSFHVTE